VVVAGGGMVGSAAALAIAKLECFQSKKVVLLEAAPAKSNPVEIMEYSNRVSALNPSSVSLLDQLGVWSNIKRSQPVKRMQVWDSCSESAIVFEDHLQPMSHLVENDLTVDALTREMENCDNLEVKYEANVEKYNLGESKVDVMMKGGDELTTDMLVGADGFRSLVRQTLGGEYLGWDYNQMGIVATLSIDSQGLDNTTAWQRFLPGGPVAVLPLSDGSSSLVWTVPKTEARTLIDLDEDVFVDLLNQSLTSDRGQNTLVNSLTRGLDTLLSSLQSPGVQTLPPPVITGASNRAAFPLGFGHSPVYRGTRTVLVGDAAHRVHPLAGQGVNLGFGDVRELVEQIEAMVMNGAGLGHHQYLKDYETNRQKHNVATMLGVDALQKLYCSDFTPLVLARSLGLKATAACTPLTTLIKSHAAL